MRITHTNTLNTTATTKATMASAGATTAITATVTTTTTTGHDCDSDYNNDYLQADATLTAKTRCRRSNEQYLDNTDNHALGMSV